MRKYNAYYFSYAITLDWYMHPLEASVGHLTGLLLDFMIFWQAISIYTPAHRNKWWCVSCEFLVILHGPLIAMNRGEGSGMFGFGFTIVFLCSGQWGLPLDQTARIGFLFILVGSMAITYGIGLTKKVGDVPVTWNDLPEVMVVPIIYYFSMCGFFLIYMMTVRLKFIQNRPFKIAMVTLACVIACSFGFIPFIMLAGMH